MGGFIFVLVIVVNWCDVVYVDYEVVVIFIGVWVIGFKCDEVVVSVIIIFYKISDYVIDVCICCVCFEWCIKFGVWIIWFNFGGVFGKLKFVFKIICIFVGVVLWRSCGVKVFVVII